MPIIWKLVAEPRTVVAPDSKGRLRPVRITPARIKHWYRQGKDMLRAGLSIPVPKEHQDVRALTRAERAAKELDNNAGWVHDYRMGKGHKLYSALDISDPEYAKKLGDTIKHVSPEADSFTDGDGRRWTDVIDHIALTLRPRFTAGAQEPFSKNPVDLPPGLAEAVKTGLDLGDAEEPEALSMSGPLRLSLDTAVKRRKKDGAWEPMNREDFEQSFAGYSSEELSRLKFSHEGDTDMADEEEEYAEGEEEEEPEEELEEEGETEEEESSEHPNQSEEELIGEASEVAEELGLHVPDAAENCEEWVRHFITAGRTHLKTLEQEGEESEEEEPEEEGEEEPEATPGNVTEEAPTMLMSISACETSFQKKTFEREEKRIKAERQQKLKKLEKMQAMPKPKLDKLKAEVAAARFSMTPDGDVVPHRMDDRLDDLLDAASMIDLQVRLSQGSEEGQPGDDTFETRQQEQQEVQEGLVDEMAGMLGFSKKN